MILYDYLGNQFDTGDPFDYTKYQYRAINEWMRTGLRVIYLDGDIDGMTKDVKKTLNWKFDTLEGTCTCKWQGDYSLTFPKKNYNLKLKDTSDWGAVVGLNKWGAQNRYVLKAFFNDFSHAIYMCSAKLWGKVVESRGQSKVPAPMWNSLNFGTVDGFPVMLVMNGVYQGLYTVMTHKDTITKADTVGGYYLIGTNADSGGTTATSFNAHTSASNLADELDYEVVYSPNEDDLSPVAASLNTCIDSVLAGNANWESNVANYLDVDSAIDYLVFRAFLGDRDGVNKNKGIVTYDGVKWYHTAYDLDDCLSGSGAGSQHYAPRENTYAQYKNWNRVFNLILTYSKEKFKSRYNELRSDILQEGNVFNLFANYINDIPYGLFAEEDKLWPMTPNSSTLSLHFLDEWYRHRCEWSDEYVNSL